MQTRLLFTDSQSIAEAAAVIRQGGLVAFPTETVYGLGANALDAVAVARIFAAKERPASDPLIVHIADLAQLETVVAAVPPLALRLAAQFWPGPLTLVLPRGAAVPPSVSAGRATVAVRWPSHPVAQALIAAAGVPIAAPSANRFTRPSPTTAQHVLDDLAGRVALILDGGPSSIGVESSVLDLTADPPRLLRPGGVPLEALRAALPEVAFSPSYLREDQEAAGPGMLLRHYAPRVTLRVYSGPAAAALAALRAAATAELAAGRRVGALLPDEDLAQLRDLPLVSAALGPEADAAQAAARLFAGLRALEPRCDLILARTLERAGLGLAVWDRLFRATEGQIIEVG